ncbi:hypothetical protein CBR_g126 [Chara braunii]|uniref:F-box domain-containing protein n=1 Tax=Chara braunii TaxID=69332 RepID=A0A388JLW1_CHABU|nr:hypothetical protein CBR_g126 [Chara braunii]|eukprot:GBG58725.1 hypothetical protein CBR_g126 [Chara braunii]
MLSASSEEPHADGNRSAPKRRCDDGDVLSQTAVEEEGGTMQPQLQIAQQQSPDGSHEDRQSNLVPPSEEEGRKRQRVTGGDALSAERDSPCRRAGSPHLEASTNVLLMASPSPSQTEQPITTSRDKDSGDGDGLSSLESGHGNGRYDEVGKGLHVAVGGLDCIGERSDEEQRNPQKQKQKSDDLDREAEVLARVSDEFEVFKAKVELVSEQFREFKARVAEKVRSRLRAAAKTKGVPYDEQTWESKSLHALPPPSPLSPLPHPHPPADIDFFLPTSSQSPRFASASSGNSCSASALTSSASAAAACSSASAGGGAQGCSSGGEASAAPVRLSPPASGGVIEEDLRDLKSNALPTEDATTVVEETARQQPEHQEKQEEEGASANEPPDQGGTSSLPLNELSPTLPTSAASTDSAEKQTQHVSALPLPRDGCDLAVNGGGGGTVVVVAAESTAEGGEEKISEGADKVDVIEKESGHGGEEVPIADKDKPPEEVGEEGDGKGFAAFQAAAAAPEAEVGGVAEGEGVAEGGGMVEGEGAASTCSPKLAADEVPRTPVAKIVPSGIPSDDPAAGYISPQSIKRIIKLQMSDVSAGTSGCPLPEDDPEPSPPVHRSSPPLRLGGSTLQIQVKSVEIGTDERSLISPSSLSELSLREEEEEGEVVSPHPLLSSSSLSSETPPLTTLRAADDNDVGWTEVPCASSQTFPPPSPSRNDIFSEENMGANKESSVCTGIEEDRSTAARVAEAAAQAAEEKDAADADDQRKSVGALSDAAGQEQVEEEDAVGPEEGKGTATLEDSEAGKEKPSWDGQRSDSIGDLPKGKDERVSTVAVNGKGNGLAGAPASSSSSHSRTTVSAPSAVTLHLPNDTLSVVFSFLPVQDRLFTVPCVCRQWRAVASRPKNYRVVDALDWTESRILCASLLTFFPVRPLWRLVNGRITRSAADELLRRLVYMSRGHLEVLRSKNCSSAGLWYLAVPSSSLTSSGGPCVPSALRLTELELLDLLEPVDDPLCRLLSPRLKRLVLSPAYPESHSCGDGSQHVITDKLLYALAETCPELTHLNIRECRGVTDKGLIAVARRCPALREVGLEGCLVKEEDAVWVTEAFSRNCPSLTAVNLSQSDLPGDALPHLFGRCRRLAHVSLTHLWSNPHSSHVTKALESMGEVRELAVSSNRWFGDAESIELAKWAKHLTSLDVTQTSVGDVGMGAIVGKLGWQLRSLRATDCKISDASVLAITSCCFELRHLQLGSANMTDSAASLIARGTCRKLTTLRLWSRTNPSQNPCFQSMSDLRLLCYRIPNISVLSLALCDLSKSGVGGGGRAGDGSGSRDVSQANGGGGGLEGNCWTGAVEKCSSASFLDGISALAGTLTRLRLVGRQSWRFSEFGAEFCQLLSKCEKLEAIDLQYINGINDSDLLAWGDAAPRLQWAMFHYCERVTSEGVKALLLRCKKLRGVRAHCSPIPEGKSWEWFSEVQVALRGGRVLDGRRRLTDPSALF